MTFKTSYNAGLGQPAFTLTAVDTTPKVAIGTIIKAFDDVQGEGEFIYLPGQAGLLAGDIVTYQLNPGTQSVTRASTAQVNTGTPVAFALVAVPTGSYGWFQIGGCAIANATAGGAGRPGLTATAGSVAVGGLAAGAQILGATSTSALGTPAAGQIYITISRPFTQGQIT